MFSQHKHSSYKRSWMPQFFNLSETYTTKRFGTLKWIINEVIKVNLKIFTFYFIFACWVVRAKEVFRKCFTLCLVLSLNCKMNSRRTLLSNHCSAMVQNKTEEQQQQKRSRRFLSNFKQKLQTTSALESSRVVATIAIFSNKKHNFFAFFFLNQNFEWFVIETQENN